MTSFVQSVGLPSVNSGSPRTLTTVNDGASIALACLSQIAAEGVTPTAPGVTFILAQSKNMSGITMSTRWYVAHGVPAGTVITFTPSAMMKWAVDMWEALGGDGTLGASDSVTNDTTAASSAAAAPGLAVPAGAGVLALFHCDRSPGAITPPTGFAAGTQIVTDENPHYTFAFSRTYSSAASNQRGTLASQASTMNYSAALLVFPAAAATAPVLSSPTAGTPGSTAIAIGATTDRPSDGTMRFLRRVGGSAADGATIASTGESQAATANPQSRNMTGFTPSAANNYVDMVQVGAGGNSNVVTAGPFTMADPAPSELAIATALEAVTSALSFTPVTLQGRVTVTKAWNGGGSIWASRADLIVHVNDYTTNALIHTFTGVTTDAGGAFAVQGPQLGAYLGQRVSIRAKIPPNGSLLNGAEGSWYFNVGAAV